MQITSLQNERVKHLVKLRDDRRQRQRDGLMLVEGWDEIRLALASGAAARTLVTCPDLAARPLAVPGAEIITVTAPVFEKISYRDNPDGWMAVVPVPHRAFSDLELGPKPLLVVAESVEKPGNLGAILRTADASAVDALLVTDPHTDPYGPNVVRASRGTVFSVPCIQSPNAETFDFLRQRGVRILAATPGASSYYYDEDLTGPVAIAVGTEDEGLTDFWLERADARVLIPMLGQVNSLNVSVATALILYEAVRQRRRLAR